LRQRRGWLARLSVLPLKWRITGRPSRGGWDQLNVRTKKERLRRREERFLLLTIRGNMRHQMLGLHT
jgi:hypothetical protein